MDPLGLTAQAVTRRFDPASPTAGSPAGTLGATGSSVGPDACAFSACAGQQAGGDERFVLHGDADADEEVDAAKSARRARRYARRESPRFRGFCSGRRLGGGGIASDPVHVGEEADGTASFEIEVSLARRTRGGGLLSRVGAIGSGARAAWHRTRGRLGGWWNRTFPEGSAGAQVGSAWRWGQAWLRARDATQLNYAADTLESAPTLLRFSGLSPLAGPAEQALQRSGLVDAMRDHAAEEYGLALEENAEAAESGADAGLAIAVVIDAAMPGPGGEAKAAAKALEHADEAAAALAKVADEAMKSATAALAKGADEGVLGRAPQVTEAMIRDAMQGAPLKSQQAGGVSLPRVQAYVDKIASGEVPPAIKVDGEMIVDGNHRYISGRIMGQEPSVQTWVGGRPGSAVDWDTIPIDPEPW